jgi:hypothetical protein
VQSSLPTSNSNGCSPNIPRTIFDASDSSISANRRPPWPSCTLS